MEKFTDNFGFMVLGLALAAAVFFGAAAWFAHLRRQRLNKKLRAERKQTTILRNMERMAATEQRQRDLPPLDFNRSRKASSSSPSSMTQHTPAMDTFSHHHHSSHHSHYDRHDSSPSYSSCHNSSDSSSSSNDSGSSTFSSCD